jgi:ABC-2 type transport system ATP-binding protein
MGASRYVGRVGGLAVALGVGAAMFSGSGLASADSGSRGADSTGASNATESSASPASRNQPSARRANPGASRGAATRNNDRARAASPQLSASSITAPVAGAARRAAALAVVVPEPATDSVAADDFTVVPPAVELPETAGPDIRVHIDPTPDPVEAYEVTAFLSEAGNDVSDGADTDPLVPADPLASGELLAFVRRNTLALANSNAVAPQVTSSATATSGSLTVDPTVEFDNGIIFGTLQATSAAGNKLTYTVLGGSCGDG